MTVMGCGSVGPQLRGKELATIAGMQLGKLDSASIGFLVQQQADDAYSPPASPQPVPLCRGVVYRSNAVPPQSISEMMQMTVPSARPVSRQWLS
jgi:hypothetical protein